MKNYRVPVETQSLSLLPKVFVSIVRRYCTIDQSIECIAEVTPETVRLRKMELDANKPLPEPRRKNKLGEEQ